MVDTYATLRDGGVKLREENIPGTVVGKIDGNIYKNPTLVAGGDKNLGQLFEHPVVQALIPDETLRRKYLSAL